MSLQCWASVIDAGPALTRHWCVNAITPSVIYDKLVKFGIIYSGHFYGIND